VVDISPVLGTVKVSDRQNHLLMLTAAEQIAHRVMAANAFPPDPRKRTAR